MIGVWGFENKVKVVCSGEKVSVDTIKNIVKDIRRVASKTSQPCCVEIKSFDNIKFTKRGEVFLKRVMELKEVNSSELTIDYVF